MDCSHTRMVGPAGGVFDHRQELTERLQYGPSEEARQVGAPTANGLPPSRWSLRSIQATFPWLHTYSLSGVWRLVQGWGVHLRQGRLPLYSPDPAYATKVDRLLHCLREAAQTPGEVVVLFLDEMGYFRWPEAGPDWVEAAPALPPQAKRAGPNNRQQRIIGALNAVTGQVSYLDAYIVGREKVIAFYQQVAQIYGQARRVYVVQDNWSIHTHPEVLAALAKLPRLEPIWLPTYAPWLNPIEKLWRWLHQDVLKLHRLAGDWAALRQLVQAFLDQFAAGSHDLLRYVGLLGEGRLAQALRVA